MHWPNWLSEIDFGWNCLETTSDDTFYQVEIGYSISLGLREIGNLKKLGTAFWPIFLNSKCKWKTIENNGNTLKALPNILWGNTVEWRLRKIEKKFGKGTNSLDKYNIATGNNWKLSQKWYKKEQRLQNNTMCIPLSWRRGKRRRKTLLPADKSTWNKLWGCDAILFPLIGKTF